MQELVSPTLHSFNEQLEFFTSFGFINRHCKDLSSLDKFSSHVSVNRDGRLVNGCPSTAVASCTPRWFHAVIFDDS